MHFPRRLAAAAAGLAVAALAVTACSAGDSDAAPTATESGATSGGGSIVVAEYEPDSLIPGQQTVAYDQMSVLFSPLVGFDDDLDLTYVQAESVTSDDATTWTITLRDGWTFHDGTPVTAESYVDAWNYVAYGPNAMAQSGLLAAIEGYDDLNPESGTPTTTTMSGLQVVDDLTFTVTLTRPDSQFPIELTKGQTAFYPMPESAYADMDAYNRHPIGNGPFEMSGDWVDNEPVVVTRYAGYQGEAPTVDEIEFRSYVNLDTAYTDALAGQVDVLSVRSAQMTSVNDDFDSDHLYVFDAPAVSWIGFPAGDERFADVRVRQAVSMSIDRDAVNQAIYGGLYTPADGLTSKAQPGGPDDACGQYCTFDPDAAKQLLAEAGGWTGMFELIYPGGMGFDQLYEALANQVRQNLGVDAVATPTTDYAEFRTIRSQGAFTGAHWGRWGALYPSQQNTLRSSFTEDGSGYMGTQYSNDEVDALLDAADAATTQDEAQAGYAAAQERIMQDFPVVPLFYDTYVYATSDKVTALPAVAGSPILSQVVVSH